MNTLIKNLSIGLESFMEALYWWSYNEDTSGFAAFWIELNCGYYQLHPQQYRQDILDGGYADVVYTV